MTKSTKSPLGESWVVNDGSDGDISWKGSEASASDSEPTSRPLQKRVPPRMAPNRRSKSPQPSHPAPDLVFPTVESPPPKSRTAIRQSQLRQRRDPSTPQPPKMTARIKPPAAPPEPSSSDSSPLDTTLDILGPIFDYIFSILKSTLLFLRKPISWVLALYLFAGLLTLVSNLLTSSIYTALSPICRLPGVSFLSLPICSYGTPDPSQATISATSNADPEFSSLMSTHSHFSDILSSSSAAVGLPISMKQSETSIRDLRQIVRFSSLSSRNELVLEFDGFIETARSASYDLQKFNSHVGRGVDIVLSTARWTQRVLDDMAFQDSQSGYLPSALSRLLTPFQPVPFTEARLLDQYITHTRIISDEIAKLIDEATALLLVLQNLEDRLDVIHSISLRDRQGAQISKDEILTHLWTLLGGNRAQVSKYDRQLRLLRQVGEYRKVAWAHVSATVLRLQAMGAELEELRERVGSAEAESLVTKPKDRVPLSVHLEAIKLGVERLEGERERGRELERGHVNRVLGDASEGRILEGIGSRKDLDG